MTPSRPGPWRLEPDSDPRTAVPLRMRAQADVGCVATRLHRGEIAIELLTVEAQIRRQRAGGVLRGHRYRLGTVPARACGRERISTNHAIARYLDDRRPEPPLFPADPERRAAVEDVERWANGSLQMYARRVVGPAVMRDPDGFSRSSADGRMGPLLYRHRLAFELSFVHGVGARRSALRLCSRSEPCAFSREC